MSVFFVGIDPSTKTGFCRIDINGKVLVAKEITGVGKVDPQRICTMVNAIRSELRKTDIVAIEGFGFSSQQAIQMGWIGGMIRALLFNNGMNYQEIAPNALKARVGVSGWTGEKGAKVRLKGKEKKQEVITATDRTFGRSFSNDNINDSYVLAQMARENYLKEMKVNDANVSGSLSWEANW